MLENIYNRLPTSLRPYAKSLYVAISSTPRVSLQKRIGHATTTDFETWNRDPGNPVFAPAKNNTDWDGVTVEDPDLICQDDTFVMAYAGHGEFDWETKQIGIAMSNDGTIWSRSDANPVLSPGEPDEWHNRSVQNPAIVCPENTCHMVFDGSDSEHGWIGLGHAMANDVSDWTYDTANPILELGSSGSWDDEHVADPSIVYHDGVYHIYYGGRQNNEWKIGHATTTDFKDVTKDPNNPIIAPEGVNSEYKHVNDPNVIHDGERFHMIYAANTGSVKRFEYASSTDGDTWELREEPTFSPDPATGWEGTKLTNPGLLYDGDTCHLYYVGVTEE